MKLDILAFGAHPDDIELSAGGTIALQVKRGQQVGLVDLTHGEMGTRGNKEIRLEEAEKARQVLGAAVRLNLGFRDVFFVNDEAHQLEVIRVLRHYRPDMVICNAIYDRHPDHGKGSSLVSDACFYAGLRRIETTWAGALQQPWRPKAVYHYIQFRDIQPHFFVDISEVVDIKMESIRAHKSQFFDPDSKEPETLIAQPGFLDNILSRTSYWGQSVGVAHAEGFTAERIPAVRNLADLL